MVSTSTDTAVRNRYSAAAQSREPALCCPVDYDTALLDAIPDRVIERDYGCGDPSKPVQPGDTVLDLGSGGGKIAFMAAQRAGPRGRVIGIEPRVPIAPESQAPFDCTRTAARAPRETKGDAFRLTQAPGESGCC